MPNHKMTSAFVTCTLPKEMPLNFNRVEFFSMLSIELQSVALPLRFLSVLETGGTGENLHLHYAVEWPEAHAQYSSKINSRLKILYKKETDFAFQRSTIRTEKVQDFYSLCGGYLAKEPDHKVLASYCLDETEMALGALRYERGLRASLEKRSKQTKTDAFYDSFFAWHNKYSLNPSTHCELVERIVLYTRYALDEGKPAYPLASQFAARGILFTIAARLDLPDRYLDGLFTRLIDF